MEDKDIGCVRGFLSCDLARRPRLHPSAEIGKATSGVKFDHRGCKANGSCGDKYFPRQV